ncbi:hypothetical protein CVT24_011262 [Panaeolus cyanescens]|uniref:Mid2 domain-containing protein n=1 Tax=Panaeolus cyanescens TaxID=181874 RepID=A0A409VI49_9AGAR|nr:hypothetical protein CVT24_011262 [Panaeolus cyanescens]
MASAGGGIAVNSPSFVTLCESLVIGWFGGIRRIVIRVTDSVNTIALSRVIPVEGNDRSCLGGSPSSLPPSSSISATSRTSRTTTPAPSPSSRMSSTSESLTSISFTDTPINSLASTSVDPSSGSSTTNPPTSPTSFPTTTPVSSPDSSGVGAVSLETGKNAPVGAIVGAVLGGLAALLGTILLFYYCKRRRRGTKPEAQLENQQTDISAFTPITPQTIFSPAGIYSKGQQTPQISQPSSFQPLSKRNLLGTSSAQNTSSSGQTSPESDSSLITAPTAWANSPTATSTASSSSAPVLHRGRHIDAGPLPAPEALSPEDDAQSLPPHYLDVFGRSSRGLSLVEAEPHTARQQSPAGNSVKSPHD